MTEPVGEENWLAFTDEAVRTARDIEQCVNVIELYKTAVNEETGSLPLWRCYCSFFWSLWRATQDNEGRWAAEEEEIGKELFSLDTALDLWQQAYEATKYRLDDSHILWNEWIKLELDLLRNGQDLERSHRIEQLFRDRLVTPHLTWDETSQMFSGFLSEYAKDSWERSMAEMTSAAQDAKAVVAMRDPFEVKLKQAASESKIEEQKSAMWEYLEWEMLQCRRNSANPENALDLAKALYSRALTGIYANDDAIWYEYIVFLSTTRSDHQPAEDMLDTIRRAVQHCRGSGRLWNRYILTAEEANLEFSEIEAIKNAAISENELYANGMENMIEMYEAWCGFLKRMSMNLNASDAAISTIDTALRAALDDVRAVGKRLIGKEFQGDPKFRLERIYIQYLTEKRGAISTARALWERLSKARLYADNHDFWIRYYTWELLLFLSDANLTSTIQEQSEMKTPTLAAAVLQTALKRRTIDWPEKIFDAYLQHCRDYELPSTVRKAMDTIQRAEKGVKKRREREEQENTAAYAAYYAAPLPEPVINPDIAMSDSPSGQKRKHETHSVDDADAHSIKRQKSTAAELETDIKEEEPKRSREHATILVVNLPGNATQTKLRQYFKRYGHIKNITALIRENDGATSTALIEFNSPAEAESALLSDKKYFEEFQISVASGYDLTVYVANYPPAADDKYIRDLFEDCGEIMSIRWPSLKYNSHRRFCYVSFRTRDASSKAVQKDGTMLDEKYKLLAKYSDPEQKKKRDGAVADGREVYVSNLDRIVTEEELKDVFSKYGNVTRVNLPISMTKRNRGFAFLDLATKDDAEVVVSQLNNTKLRSQIIQVELSKVSKVKHSAVSSNVESIAESGGDKASPHFNDPETSESQSAQRRVDIKARTIALMGLPDTVNDARVRALLEPMGEIVKLILVPSRGGATIEFIDAATAGKAALNLNNMEYEGSILRTGSDNELYQARPEKPVPQTNQKSKDAKPSSLNILLQPTSTRHPGVGKAKAKRGLGFAPRAKNPKPVASEGEKQQSISDDTNTSKSNADFKAMFLGTGSNQ